LEGIEVLWWLKAELPILRLIQSEQYLNYILLFSIDWLDRPDEMSFHLLVGTPFCLHWQLMGVLPLAKKDNTSSACHVRIFLNFAPGNPPGVRKNPGQKGKAPTARLEHADSVTLSNLPSDPRLLSTRLRTWSQWEETGLGSHR
jgi:hypothetical protein